MKKWILFLALTGLSWNVLSQKYDNDAAIREVIQEAFVNGIYNEGYLRSVELSYSNAFQSIRLVDSERVEVETLADWITRVRENQAAGKYPVPDDQRVSVKYLKIDIIGTAANVEFNFMQGGKVRHTDFLALYKFNSGWRIVNRIFYEPPLK